jgi:23S rRNA (uracil747-C5)-methyltransferase
MGVPYAAQLASKENRCHEAVAGFVHDDAWLAPVRGPESGFRNKAKLVAAGRPGAVTLGILDGSGRGVDLQGCGLYEPRLAESLPLLADFIDRLGIEPYDVPGRRGQLKYVIVTHSPDDELMVRFVLRTPHEVARIRKALPGLSTALPGLAVVSVNLQPEHKAILEGDTEIPLSEREILPMRVNDVVLGLRPNSFFQTNTDVAAALYRQAREWVEVLSPRSVWDLYCGVGGFALHVVGLDTPDRSVLGVEISTEAIESARASAESLRSRIPGWGEVRFVVGDATQVGHENAAATPPDLVIVNPPRRGLGPELTAWLESSGVPDVIYSSCNVDSLPKDLAELPSYRVEQARLFDMFPQTNHHEVMVRLAHRRAIG